VMMRLHGVKPGERADDGFAPPPGRVAIDMCLARGADGRCASALTEWAAPQDVAAAPAAQTVAFEAVAAPGPLVIATPEHNTRVWRNPEQPAVMNALALKLRAPAPGEQIVWQIDGEPFALAQSEDTVFWPMQPGEHRIEARRALQPGKSRAVRVVVE